MDLLDIDIHDDRVPFVEAKPAGWAGYIPIKDVHAALELAGIPPQLWPNVPSDNRCLERAMLDLRSSTNLIRPLPKGRGWALVIEDASALDLERLDADEEEAARAAYEALCRRLDAASEALAPLQPLLKHAPFVFSPADVSRTSAHKVEITAKVERGEGDSRVSTLRITPEDHPAVPLIKDQFMFHRGTSDEDLGMYKASQDLSVWFSQTIIPWVRGVSTRSRGGSYYVIKGINLKRLETVALALEACSTYTVTPVGLPGGQTVNRTKTLCGGRIIIKPEVGTRVAIEIMVDSIINETDKLCDEEALLMTSGKKGVRALTSSTERLDAQRVKLKEFEETLGVALTDMQSRLTEVTAANGMLALKLEAEKDQAA